MNKLVLLGSALLLVGTAGMASARTFQVDGHVFTYGSFRPRMVDVTLATERGTGRRMNFIRLRNGHMMALVQPQLIMGLAVPGSSADDMLQ